MHTHPPHFAYVIRGGQVRFSYPDGQIRDVPLQAGQRFEIPRRLTHAVEVTGGDTVIVLLVEYRLDTAAVRRAEFDTRIDNPLPKIRLPQTPLTLEGGRDVSRQRRVISARQAPRSERAQYGARWF